MPHPQGKFEPHLYSKNSFSHLNMFFFTLNNFIYNFVNFLFKKKIAPQRGRFGGSGEIGNQTHLNMEGKSTQKT